MGSLSNYFLSIGIYNLLGSALLFVFLSNKYGDLILRKSFRILTTPYSLESNGYMWLVWAATLNLFYGVTNILAFRWDQIAKIDLLYINLILYSVFLVYTIRLLFSPNYSYGVWFNLPIFSFWILWTIYLISLQ